MARLDYRRTGGKTAPLAYDGVSFSKIGDKPIGSYASPRESKDAKALDPFFMMDRNHSIQLWKPSNIGL